MAVSSTVLIGFAALAIDVGYLHNTRAELQRTADASALAAATTLADYQNGNPMNAARQAAQDLAIVNTAAGQGVALDLERDVTFGQSEYNAGTDKYAFAATTAFPNAVHVSARRTTGSPSGPMPLFFAAIFGKSSANVSASATAVLIPRDIVFVLDLSASHNDDSCLRSYKNTEIANRDVWQSLWDESLAAQLGVPRPTDGGVAAGPKMGNMSSWGTATTGPGWDFTTDTGLARLAKGSNWTVTGSYVSQTLSAQGYGSYVATEVSGINTQPSSYASGDSATKYYRRRVRIALGLDRWNSGKAGGQAGGNGDNYINSNEVVSMIPYPSSPTNPVTLCKQMGGSWDTFVDYVASSSSLMCQYNPASQYYGDAGLQYRFGLKTFMDFLQEKQTGDATSPGFRGVPEQPMGAVADGTRTMLSIIADVESNDLVGMASYGTVGYGPVEKPNNMSWLTDNLGSLHDKVGLLQANMWTGNTNMAQGIDRGVDVLTLSPEARPYASKFMIVLTDGQPNQTRANPTQYYSELCQTCPPRADARAAAQDARTKGIRIYTVSVGANADQPFMDELAAIGGGEHFHAQGSVAAYTAQLQQIFQKLGGKRTVMLIE